MHVDIMYSNNIIVLMWQLVYACTYMYVCMYVCVGSSISLQYCNMF